MALSCVKTKGGLSLKGFNLNQLIPLPKIIRDFYESVKLMPVQVLKNDLTCCINNPNFEAHVVREALLLETVDWDKVEFKIDEPEWEISVLDEPNETSELEITPDEDETNTDQIESENYFGQLEVDFGLILDALETENSLSLEFLNGFQVNQFMETSKENLKLDSDWDTKEKLA